MAGIMRSGALAAAVFLSPLAVPPSACAAPRVHTIVIDKMVFGPAPTAVHAGDVVVWVNRDMFRHTATARDKSFDVDVASGKSARTVVKNTGTISYYCRYHPGMTGRMVVAGK
jgi:plastocyanin